MMRMFVVNAQGFTIDVALLGSVRSQEDIQVVWTDVPEGKSINQFDMTGEEPMPVFQDAPKTELELTNQRIADLEIAMAAVMGRE